MRRGKRKRTKAIEKEECGEEGREKREEIKDISLDRGRKRNTGTGRHREEEREIYTLRYPFHNANISINF